MIQTTLLILETGGKSKNTLFYYKFLIFLFDVIIGALYSFFKIPRIDNFYNL